MPSELLTAIYSQHTAHLQRVGVGLGNDAIPYLENIEESISKIFYKYRGRTITMANRLAIIEQINTGAKEQLQLYVAQLKVSNRSMGADEAKFAADTFNRVVIDEVNLVTPTAAQVNAVAISTPIRIGEGAYTSYSSLMTNYWQKWTAQIDGAVLNGFNSGRTIDDVAKSVYEQIMLVSTNNSPNTLVRARRSARALAITGTNHYANQARIAFVDQNDEQIKGYRFIAVLDSRTSPFCRPLDQKVFAKDSKMLSIITPPRHPNCRSALVYEVIDKYKLDVKDRKRASNFDVDGKRDPKQVTSDGIYYQKMAQLKAADQDAILGPTLGRAFRKLDNPEQFAELTIDSLANPLTIAEMKLRDNALGDILQNL